MLKLPIATITLVLGANALASAADLPPQTVAPLTSPVPAYDWTGFYAGGNIGFGTDRYTFLTVSKVRVLNFFRGAGRSFRMDRSGALKLATITRLHGEWCSALKSKPRRRAWVAI